jgi:FkbM family methyltransferase
MVSKIYSFLKDRALSLLPESVLQPLRVWHHRRTLQSSLDVEEPDLTIVRQLVGAGSVVVDLGANIGVFTKVLSDLVGPSGTVISVEPVPQTFDVLSRNVHSLGMSNVSCVNAAVSDSPGSVVMELPKYRSGGVNFYQASVVAGDPTSSSKPRQHIHVPAVTLDSLVAGKGTIGFVKCDVEGHELACLSGAHSLLTSHSPAWLIEIWGDPEDARGKARQTFQVFENHSYASWWFDGKLLRRRRAGERSTNYFFLKDKHVATLKGKAPQLFQESIGSSA